MDAAVRRDLARSAERRALWILTIVATWMTAWIVWRWVGDPSTYVESRLGLGPALTTTLPWIWLPTLVVVVSYCGYTLWAVPAVRGHVLRFDLLGLVAVWAAVASGIIEEVVFRHLLMDTLQGRGAATWIQVLVSAVCFGAAHALWMLWSDDRRMVIPVVASTTVLGAALAVLYLIAARSTFPSIVAHVAINLVIEPGLVVASCRWGTAETPIR